MPLRRISDVTLSKGDDFSCVGFINKHVKRDEELQNNRNKLLNNAVNDFQNDSNVLAIYLAGSLARGTEDNYSDIDLHIIVKPEMKMEFIRQKQVRPKNWGDILFFEDATSQTPYIVTHFENFVKVDTWYKVPDEVVPSIWMKSIKPVFDPEQIISKVIEASKSENSTPTYVEVEFWRCKLFAFIHETYRACMRNELYHASSNLDRISWLIAYGWYLEMERHFDRPYGNWSKIEGNLSILNEKQLTMLKMWTSKREVSELLSTMVNMFPEIIRLNQTLCKKVNIDEETELLNKVLRMVY